METIFDFNPTKDDLFDILSYPKICPENGSGNVKARKVVMMFF